MSTQIVELLICYKDSNLWIGEKNNLVLNAIANGDLENAQSHNQGVLPDIFNPNIYDIANIFSNLNSSFDKPYLKVSFEPPSDFFQNKEVCRSFAEFIGFDNGVLIARNTGTDLCYEIFRIIDKALILAYTTGEDKKLDSSLNKYDLDMTQICYDILENKIKLPEKSNEALLIYKNFIEQLVDMVPPGFESTQNENKLIRMFYYMYVDNHKEILASLSKEQRETVLHLLTSSYQLGVKETLRQIETSSLSLSISGMGIDYNKLGVNGPWSDYDHLINGDAWDDY